MSRKTHTEIYPQPLVLPPATLTDKDKEPYVEVVVPDSVGDGSDGDLIVSSNIVVNKYAGLNNNTTIDYPIGSEILHVDSNANISLFSVGQEIMIIQMQDYRAGKVGTYEYNRIVDIVGNDITLEAATRNAYYSDDNGNKQNNTKTQIVSIPNYNSVVIQTGTTIGGDAWDGYKGGIVVFRSKLGISGAGNISAAGIGYRGYPYHYANGELHSGEGHKGNDNGTAAPNFGGAGGNTGGGHALAAGGGIIGTDDLLNELTFGGGGGGYSSNPGGPGGGIVAIYTPNISLTGTISANGSYKKGAGGSVAIFGVDGTGLTINVFGEGVGSIGYSKNYVAIAPIISIKYRSRQTIPTIPDPVELPPLGVNNWKMAVDGETIVNGMGYIIDASAGSINLNLPVPTSGFTFQFGYRVINADNSITFNTSGAKWESIDLIDNQLDIEINNVSGQPIYTGTVNGWVETDIA